MDGTKYNLWSRLFYEMLKQNMEKRIKHWTEDEETDLMLMINIGKNYDEISKKINRTISACHTRVHNIRCGIFRV